MPFAHSPTRVSLRRLASAATLVLLGAAPALPAQLAIPSTSGFGGFGVFALAAYSGRTNFFASGPPLIGAISRPVTTSIFAAPSELKAAAALIGGEVNYTFANTRTQLFIAQSLEDGPARRVGERVEGGVEVGGGLHEGYIQPYG